MTTKKIGPLDTPFRLECMKLAAQLLDEEGMAPAVAKNAPSEDLLALSAAIYEAITFRPWGCRSDYEDSDT